MSIRAFILATPAQLKAINIDDTYITNMLCDALEINQHINIIGKCSRCIMRKLNGAIDEYIIPTQWLKFITDSKLTS